MPYTERTFRFEGTTVSYLEGGSGCPVLLLHGSGPGASSLGNWRPILEPLAEKFHVFAMDLIGFGNSGRRAITPYFDVDLWFRQGTHMISLMPGASIGVLGHSLSGMLALRLAASHPRISGVMTTATMGAPFVINEATVRCWTFPETVEELRAVGCALTYDNSLINETYISTRKRILYDDPSYGEYFRSMFSGDKQSFVDAVILAPEELGRITCPVTMLHGRNDVAFPPTITLDIARYLPQADVVLVSRCSHSIAMESSERFLYESSRLFGRISRS